MGLDISNPDRIYVSILFNKHRYTYSGLQMMYPDSEIIYGGPGYDPTIKLPPEVEQQKPDQNLYTSKYSIGRVTSGCPRKCYFCIVPQLEPNGIRRIQGPEDIWKPKTILRLLDDNILALPSAFDEVHKFCIDNHVTVRFEYLDARFITDNYAKKLKEMKHENSIHFSFDTTSDEPHVRRGIERMIKAGHRPSSMMFLLYLHDEASIPDAMKRWDVIREYNCEPFLMVNADKRTKRLRRVARRGDKPVIWRNLTTAEVFK